MLIVDDNPDHWVLMQSALGHALPNGRYVWASNAEGALSYLDECVAQRRPLPKLVLLDLYLPDRTHGCQLLRAIKTNPAYNRMPVVVISYSDDAGDIRDIYEHGGNSYVVKPTNPVDWPECFRRLKTYWWDAVTLPNAC